MATIDLTGIWKAAKDTQDKRHEVNRGGYQGADPAASAAVLKTTRTAKASTTKAK